MIGWQQYAEPVLARLCAMSAGNVNRPSREPADRRRNWTLAKEIRRWLEGKPDAAATTDLLGTFRQASAEDASKAVVGLLNRGVGARSVWDAVLAGSGELLMRRPGIQSLHSVTTMNALRFAFETSADDETRRWLLLQAAAFMPMFRGVIASRNENLSDAKIDTLEPLAPKDRPRGREEIFADLSKNKSTAARKVLGYLKGDADPRPITDAARRLIFRRGRIRTTKVSSAVLEDYPPVARVADRYLATSVFWLKGSRSRHEPGAADAGGAEGLILWVGGGWRNPPSDTGGLRKASTHPTSDRSQVPPTQELCICCRNVDRLGTPAMTSVPIEVHAPRPTLPGAAEPTVRISARQRPLGRLLDPVPHRVAIAAELYKTNTASASRGGRGPGHSSRRHPPLFPQRPLHHRIGLVSASR